MEDVIAALVELARQAEARPPRACASAFQEGRAQGLRDAILLIRNNVRHFTKAKAEQGTMNVQEQKP